ncbi:hypothetical protein QAD02_005353 [Eretmocerus hayati]|uniref:Uncharacterized protein n=1 Tax=Eretmocerus hayati TaxID=131215 RepID=A0ACC2NSH7_9HYME|nr:hypothetical protein QAD02_005353 [Eretmocerus hayati]
MTLRDSKNSEEPLFKGSHYTIAYPIVETCGLAKTCCNKTVSPGQKSQPELSLGQSVFACTSSGCIRDTSRLQQGSDLDTTEDNEVEIVGEIIRKPKYRPLRLLAALGYIEEAEQRIIFSEEQLHEMKMNRPEHGEAFLWGHRLTWVSKPLPPPAPGVITGVKPWKPLLVPRTAEGVQAMIALKRGDCGVSSFDENFTPIVEAAGIVNVSPGKSSWKCASCYVDTYKDINLWRGWTAHRIHVLGLQSSLSPMMCECGKSAYEIKRLTSCSACIDTCMRHIGDIEKGMIFEAEFARIDPRAANRTKVTS